MREWLERVTVTGDPLAVSFDTKVVPPHLPGSAGRAIARTLRRKGCRVVQAAETFRVRGRAGPLREGELDRARAFGESLGAVATHSDPEFRQAFGRRGARAPSWRC